LTKHTRGWGVVSVVVVLLSYCLSSPVQHTLVFGHTFGEMNAHKRLVRKAGKREDRKPDSLLEEKRRAVKEPEDNRGRPADRYRSHPSKHTDREYFFQTHFGS